MKFTAGLVTKLIAALQQKLNNFSFYEAFSTGNDELYLVFTSLQKAKTFFSIRMLWKANRCFLFFSDEIVQKPTPHYHFFHELNGMSIIRIFQHPGNRSFQVDFDSNFQLVYKLYDGLTNVLLLQNAKLLYHFRKKISSDYNFSMTQLVNEKQPDTTDVFKEIPAIFSWINESNRAFLSNFTFEEQKRKLLAYYQSEQKKAVGYLLKKEQALIHLKSAMSWEEIGHLLMANMHLIPSGVSEFELIDFYRNQPITIKLKKDLSARQNAEVYYRKAKNKKNEEHLLHEQISKVQSKMEQVVHNLRLTEQAQTLRELNSLRPADSGKISDKSERFKQFQYKGFSILVGKNAVNNDELTFRYSHKNDMWLHARDVSGSHVIIRFRKGITFPMPVIEFAASLAAYYSKAKGSSLVPVVYCERKFVRKPKGSAPGEVLHQHAEIILAKPIK
jgi:predicted ribosome quality control (RQC) complex YloA/Tae2 family protein